MITKITGYVKSNRRQIVLFILIGFSTFVLNYTLVWLLFGFLSTDYRLAVSLAYVITVIAHFYLNRTFTYKAKGMSLSTHITKYGLLLLLNYFITLTVQMITVELFGLTPYYGVVLATGCVMFSSFIIMKYFVFSERRAS